MSATFDPHTDPEVLAVIRRRQQEEAERIRVEEEKRQAEETRRREAELKIAEDRRRGLEEAQSRKEEQDRTLGPANLVAISEKRRLDRAAVAQERAEMASEQVSQVSLGTVVG